MNNALLLADRLQRALECPICFELPKPGDESWADCDNGHAVCGRCYRRTAGGACSLCRENTMMLLSRSQSRIDIIEALYDYLPFTCPHPDCGKTLSGTEMMVHRNICKHKLMGCPRPGCGVVRSWFELGHLLAPDCYRLEMARTRQEGWDLIFNFSEFLDETSMLPRRAVEARRRLLTTTLEADMENEGQITFCRAVVYFEIDPVDYSVCWYVLWADRRANCLDVDRNRRVLMAASLYVSQGYWTEAGVTRLNFTDENYDTGDSSRQLIVSHRKILTWHHQAVRQYGCLKCPSKPDYEPHIHLNVILP